MKKFKMHAMSFSESERFLNNLDGKYIIDESDLEWIEGNIRIRENIAIFVSDPAMKPNPTHRARIIKSSIEPIVKCDHIEIVHTSVVKCDKLYSAECKKCGVKLEPTGWREVKE